MPRTEPCQFCLYLTHYQQQFPAVADGALRAKLWKSEKITIKIFEFNKVCVSDLRSISSRRRTLKCACNNKLRSTSYRTPIRPDRRSAHTAAGKKSGDDAKRLSQSSSYSSSNFTALRPYLRHRRFNQSAKTSAWPSISFRIKTIRLL